MMWRLSAAYVRRERPASVGTFDFLGYRPMTSPPHIGGPGRRRTLGRRSPARIAGAIAVVITILLLARVVSMGDVAVVFILLPALVGGLLAFLYPDRRPFLLASAVLMVVTAAITLIRAVGLLYVPSILLVLVCALQEPARPGDAPAEQTTHD
jgi:hypothetical protein